MYSLVVYRDPGKLKGPGFLYLYEDGLLVDKYRDGWAVITGGSILDPQKLGGITPSNILFSFLSDIKKQERVDQKGKLTMAILYPKSQADRDKYPERTFGYEKGDEPFMIHQAGRTTGCVAIEPDGWDDAVDAINQAYKDNGEQLSLIVYERY